MSDDLSREVDEEVRKAALNRIAKMIEQEIDSIIQHFSLLRSRATVHRRDLASGADLYEEAMELIQASIRRLAALREQYFKRAGKGESSPV